jgi:NADPH:quinone reductase-like Zn-dependent oxidoreductase
MKACRIHHFGSPDVIAFEKLEIPEPAAGEVLVRVKAAGVGPWDGWIRAGKSALPQPLPLTLGSDLSGVVEAVGPGVVALKSGLEVFGVTNPRFVGAYAEYAIASDAMIAEKPRSLSHIESASIPVVAVTAQQALFDHAKLVPGQRVLIHGAAGNVGRYAVQLASKAGLDVAATASKSDTDMLKTLGANQIVDYRKDKFEEVIHDVDAVIDLVGGDTQLRSFSVLRPGGKLISAVSKPDPDMAAQHHVTATFFLVDVSTVALEEIAKGYENGVLKTNVGDVLPLAEARTAHEMLEGTRQRSSGKIVLNVST